MFQPKYSITLNLLRDVAVIEAAREMITNASLVPAWERQFQQDAMIRQVFHSTHIEGNELSFTDAQQVFLHGEKANVIARDRDIQEIINYRNVLKDINEHPVSIINQDTMLHMHRLIVDKLLPPDQAGRLRTHRVAIINSQTKNIVFEPPAAQTVPSLLNDLFTWLDDPQTQELPAPLRSGICHYELVRIHPFVDGNGRTSRVMAMLLLYQGGYDMRQFFCLDEYYDQDPASYYAAIETANQTGDLTQWLEYFVHGLAIEFNRIKQRVIDLSRDHALKSKVGQIALSDRQVALLKFLSDHDTMARADWQDLIPGVSDDTILRDLKDLIKKKLIKKRGKTKAAYYVLRQ